MGIIGTTGTGLDRAIDLIASDYGLNMGLSGAAIHEGAAAADAELDAKLDMFESIEQNSIDLLKIIEIYQDKLITKCLKYRLDSPSFVSDQDQRRSAEIGFKNRLFCMVRCTHDLETLVTQIPHS